MRGREMLGRCCRTGRAKGVQSLDTNGNAAVCEMFGIGKAIVRIKRSSFRVVPFSYRDLIYSLTITRT